MRKNESPEGPRRFTVMLVHAHPDDECSSTGGLLCRCAREGHTSILVICTNGEWGEMNDKRLCLRPRENPEDRRRLGEIRLEELKRAAGILGVTHHFPLGYRDSGMDGWESNGAPEAFTNADPEEAAGKIVRLIREHRPDVLITYDEKGGYGHPDHVMAHRVAIASAEAAEKPDRFPGAGAGPWRIRKIYHTAWPRSRMLRAWRWMRLLGRKTPLDDPDFREDKYGTPDEMITTRVDVRPYLRRKWRALFTHKTQLGGNFFWWFFRLTGRFIFNEETFVCIRSDVPIKGVETSIFEGL